MRRRLLWVIPVLLVVAGALASRGLAGGEPGFTRAAAITAARRDAARPWPELTILDARIDTVTAERTTPGEVARRRGRTLGAGQDASAVVWDVTVRGAFRYEGMAAPGAPAPIYEAGERSFLYDVQTGRPLGGGVSGTQRTVPPPAGTPDATPAR